MTVALLVILGTSGPRKRGRKLRKIKLNSEITQRDQPMA
jgi:hypothetical protein